MFDCFICLRQDDNGKLMFPRSAIFKPAKLLLCFSCKIKKLEPEHRDKGYLFI